MVPFGFLYCKTIVLQCFANLLGAAEIGHKVDLRRIYSRRKRSVRQAIFKRKICTAIISGKVRGVVGGGENTFSAHDFFIFLFFLYLFSIFVFYCSHRHALKLLLVTQRDLPIIAHTIVGINFLIFFEHGFFLNFPF